MFGNLQLDFSSTNFPQKLIAENLQIALKVLELPADLPLTTESVRSHSSMSWPNVFNIENRLGNKKELHVSFLGRLQDDVSTFSIGEAKFFLNDLLQSTDRSLSVPCHHNENSWTLEVSVSRNEVPNQDSSRGNVTIQFSAHLPSSTACFATKPNPCLTISRREPETGKMIIVWESEVVRSSLTAHFASLTIPVKKLCGGNLESELTIEVRSKKTMTGQNTLIGELKTSVNHLKSTTKNLKFYKKGKYNKDIEWGFLAVSNFKISNTDDFLDLREKGWSLNVSIFADFFQNMDDCHHICNAGTLNPFQQVFKAIAGQLDSLSLSQDCAVYGFGAHLNVNGKWSTIRHSFPVCTLPAKPSDSVLDESYVNTVQSIQRGKSSRLLCAIINAALEAMPHESTRMYSVVIIVSDERFVDFDLETTKQAIVIASQKPISFVFLSGLRDLLYKCGNNEFMLTADKVATLNTIKTSDTKVPAREIFSFASASKLCQVGGDETFLSEVLSEVPEQMLQYFEWFDRVHTSVH